MKRQKALHVMDTPEEVAKAGAEALLELGKKCLENNQEACVALSGGSTPAAMYSYLCSIKAEAQKLISPIHFFFGDERQVPNGHEDSNVKLAMDGFLNPLGVPVSHIHAPDGSAPNLTNEARRYTGLLNLYLARTGSMPTFDLIFLGMGTDGHTASLFPETDALHVRDAIIVANHVPQLETWRLTISYPILNAARKAVVLCSGESKKDRIFEIFSSDASNTGSPHPIARIKPRWTDWYIDKAAASRLDTATIEANSMAGL